MKGDGVSANDLVEVPAGANDNRFNFSGMTPTGISNYLSHINDAGLSQYPGGYAPRNAYDQPRVNRLDLKISQRIPLFKPAELELFRDLTNFGSFVSKKLFNFYERTTLVESDTEWLESRPHAADLQRLCAFRAHSSDYEPTHQRRIGALLNVSIRGHVGAATGDVLSSVTGHRDVRRGWPHPAGDEQCLTSEPIVFDNPSSRWRVQVGVR